MSIQSGKGLVEMCDVRGLGKCKARANYWVQTRRDIAPSKPNLHGIRPGIRSILSCARHLAEAVRIAGAMNRAACKHFDNLDGVVVKMRDGDLWV